MKLKFSCRSQQSLWLKKIISKGLIVGLLFNNMGYSFANTKNLNERYETFEGDNIAIDNMLEEEIVDIEIEGNTLINHIDYSKMTTSPNGVSINMDTKEISFDNIISESTISYTDMNLNIKPKLKYGETYTLVLNVLQNTMVGNQFFTIVDGYGDYIPIQSVRLPHDETGFVTAKFTVKESHNDIFKIYLRNYKDQENRGIVKISNLMILEGDWTNKEVPKYFEGVKSVGQDDDNGHQLEILSSNNKANLLIDTKNEKESTTHIMYEFFDKDFVRNNVGKTLYLSFYAKTNGVHKALDCYFRNKTGSMSSIKLISDSTLTNEFKKIEGEIIIPEQVLTNNFFNFSIRGNKYVSGGSENSGTFYIKDIKLSFEKDSIWSSHPFEDTGGDYLNTYNKKEIILNKPLRALPNGMKDRIIKKNGQWVVERNIEEIVIDTSSATMYHEQIWSDYYGIKININEGLGMKIGRISGVNYYYSDFMTYPSYWNIKDDYYINSLNMYGISSIPDEYMQFFLKVPKIDIDKYSGTDDEKVQKWFNANYPTLEIYYQLEVPQYELLNVDLSLNMYLDTTYILNNSNIPTNMKIVVDRAINKAVESINLVKQNPTVENISIARMWINLIKESLNKDTLHDQLNSITEIQDLTIEKETTTANVDVYIKSKNGLSMTLSTNSIIFDEFSGTEDMEKLNAVDVTVDSSLPYRLNSYLMSEIKNENGTNIIPKELFNIKINGENDYKAFANINEKLVLKEDCPRGENRYGIDLILKGSLTHEVDVYKATIKFEAEQK